MGRNIIMRSVCILAAVFTACALPGGLWLVRPEPPVIVRISDWAFPLTHHDMGARRVALELAIARAAARAMSQQAVVRADEQTLSLPASDLGVFVDVAAAEQQGLRGLEQAHRRARRFGVRALVRRALFVPETIEVALPRKLDERVANRVLHEFAQAVYRPPVDAALLIAEHKLMRSEPGRALSVMAGVLLVQQAVADEGQVVVETTPERVAPRVTESDLAPVDVTQVLASYETSYRGKAGARAVNIRTAGRYLDGALLLPGEELSFNEVVGRRVLGRGFVDAPVIVNDEMEKDVGGGVCQVATTLHAASVFGNLQIVERRSHSRPSGYAPLGLDATVIDGKVDLRLRNPYDEPLLVHVSFPSEYVIRVELLGRKPTARVEHAYSVTATEAFSRRIWRRDDVAPDGIQKKQKGSKGMDVVSVLRIRHPNGNEERKRYASKYYPVPEVFWMSENAPFHMLPALPDGVTAVVIDGEEVETSDETGQRGEGRRPEEDVPSYRDVHAEQDPGTG